MNFVLRNFVSSLNMNLLFLSPFLCCPYPCLSFRKKNPNKHLTLKVNYKLFKVLYIANLRRQNRLMLLYFVSYFAMIYCNIGMCLFIMNIHYCISNDFISYQKFNAIRMNFISTKKEKGTHNVSVHIVCDRHSQNESCFPFLCILCTVHTCWYFYYTTTLSGNHCRYPWAQSRHLLGL